MKPECFLEESFTVLLSRAKITKFTCLCINDTCSVQKSSLIYVLQANVKDFIAFR